MRYASAPRRSHFLSTGAHQTVDQLDVGDEFSDLRLDMQRIPSNRLRNMQSQTCKQFELGEPANDRLQLSVTGPAEQDTIENFDIPVNEHAFPWNKHIIEHGQ